MMELAIEREEWNMSYRCCKVQIHKQELKINLTHNGTQSFFLCKIKEVANLRQYFFITN